MMAFRSAPVARARGAMAAIASRPSLLRSVYGVSTAPCTAAIPSTKNRYLSTESDDSSSKVPTYELELYEFVKQFEGLRPKSPSERSAIIKARLVPAFKQLAQTYIKEELGASSDITYDEQLLKYVLSEENFNDLLDSEVSEYYLRKHFRSVMRAYITSVNTARRINIKDKNLFGIQMERLGLNVGSHSETSGRSELKDGNLQTMAALSGFFGLLATGLGAFGLYLASKNLGAP